MNLSRLRIPFVLVVALLGCGRKSERVDAPKAVAVDPAPKPSAPRVAVTRPATREEALAAIDLRKMPEMPGAKDRSASAFTLRYSAPARMADAASFHRAKLRDLGWSEDKDPFSSEYAIGERLEKDGFHVWLHVVDLGPPKGWIAVTLKNCGNIDPRNLPRPFDAKSTEGNHVPNVWMGIAKASPEDIVAFYRKELGASGWQESPVEPNALRNGEQQAAFDQNGVHLLVNSASLPLERGQSLAECIVTLRDEHAADLRK
jgi:hypothetical protein